MTPQGPPKIVQIHMNHPVGPLMLAKIQIYILATAELFSQFALRNPEDKK